jgi:hypothetical protein
MTDIVRDAAGRVVNLPEAASTRVPLLPHSIRVGYRDFQVVKTGQYHQERDLGGSHESMGFLKIAGGMEPWLEAEVLIHEILHMCWRMASLDKLEAVNEELIVDQTGRQLMQVWRDNPDFRAYMNAVAAE